MFLPHPRVKVSIVGSLSDREVACSTSDRQGSNFESCVWKTVSSQSSHHPQEVLLAQFSLYVHIDGLKPESFYFISMLLSNTIAHKAAYIENIQKMYAINLQKQHIFLASKGLTIIRWNGILSEKGVFFHNGRKVKSKWDRIVPFVFFYCI